MGPQPTVTVSQLWGVPDECPKAETLSVTASAFPKTEAHRPFGAKIFSVLELLVCVGDRLALESGCSAM